MDTYTIDIELEHYYGDRLAMSNREACCRFYIRAVSRFSGRDLERYLERVRGHARAYASLSRMLRSPLRHMEAPLLLSSVIVVVASIVMTITDQFSVLVAGGASAGFVGMLHCARNLREFWQEYGMREAVFRELAESLYEETFRDPSTGGL